MRKKKHRSKFTNYSHSSDAKSMIVGYNEDDGTPKKNKRGELL